MQRDEMQAPDRRDRFPWFTELMAYAAELPPRELLFKRRQRWYRKSTCKLLRPFGGDFGPRVREINPRSGEMTIDFRLYLPVAFIIPVQIRGEFTAHQWRDMESVGADGMWTFTAVRVQAGMYYEFRCLDPSGEWRNTTDPLAYRYTKRFDPRLKQFDDYSVVPNLGHVSECTAPEISDGLTILESTLPGLLANWDSGRFFPREHGNYSLAERLLASGLIPQLHRNGYNAVMFPIQANVADMVHFDWRFGYLVSGFGAIDAEIADWCEMKELVDAFHREGVLVVPDISVVHAVRFASERSIDHIVDADRHPLWEDEQPTRHRDYGTWMYNLEDRVVRLHLVEAIVRFVCELGLGAFRLDYVDGLILQYQARTEERNYGEVLLQELQEALRARDLHPLCLSEAFSERRNRVLREFADVLYQPWVGFVIMDEALRPEPTDFGSGMGAIADAINRATRIDKPTSTVCYALSHDEASRDEDVLRGRFSWSTGAHLAQLVLNQAQRFCGEGRLGLHELLDFVADRTALIEAVTMFCADFSYMTLGDFSDMLKLGSYDDPDGWKMVWDAAAHLDLRRWAKIAGRPVRDVQRRIEQHAELMRRLRQLFIESTSVDFRTRRSCMDVSCIGCQRDDGALAILRRNLTAPRRTLLAAVNFGLRPVDRFSVTLPDDLAGTWAPCVSVPMANQVSSDAFLGFVADSDPPTIDFALPGNSIIILARR